MRFENCNATVESGRLRNCLELVVQLATLQIADQLGPRIIEIFGEAILERLEQRMG